MQAISFKGKSAVVTGGTRGIGKSIVDHLHALGCNVIFTGTKTEAPKTVSGKYLPLDLSQPQSIEQFLDQLKKEISTVDILINNAGINKINTVDQINQADWDKVIQVNLTGAMILMRELSPLMKAGGKILNVSSIFGVIAKAGRDAYAASKAGLIGLTRASALDLAPKNILVNAICPGFTKTDLTDQILSEQEQAALAGSVPLNRFARVDEIAKTAVFLCSDWNTYITGQTIVVDGGVTVR